MRESISRRFHMQAPQWTTSLIGRQVVREVVPLHVRELELAADVLREPARDLHPADVLADGVVRAGLGDEHAVAGRSCSMAERPAHQLGQVALEAREEDRERRQRHVGRRVGGDLEERLRVGDDQRRRLASGGPARRAARAP